MKKKILSFILTGAMLLSALPATIFASADANVHDHDHDIAAVEENGCPGAEVEHSLENCTNHSLVKHVEGKKNDCTDPSYDIFQCNVCHGYFVGNFTASSHHYVPVSEGWEATCQKEGQEPISQCSKCGQYENDKLDGSVIPKKKHILDGPTKPLGPGNDCTNGGYQQQCSVCHEWITVSGKHEWEFTEVTKAPVCGVSDGFALYTCKNCHTTKTVVIRKEDHQFTEEVIAAGSCTTDRIVVKTCDFCGVEVKDNQGKQHRWLDNGPHKDATCTTWGYTIQICALCGAQGEMKPIEPSGHTEKPENPTDEDDYKVATCTQPESWKCRNEGCGERVTGAPALGHKDVKPVEIPAICGRVSLTFKLCNRRDADGNLICDGCDKAAKHTSEDGVTWEFDKEYNNIIKDSYEVGKTKDPSKHLWTLKSVTKEATCTSEGIGVAYCEYCSAYDTNYVIPKKPHEKAAEKTRTKVSCTTDGAEFYLCTECDAHLEEVIFEHKLDKKEVYTKEEAEKYHNVGKLEDETWDVIRNVGVNKDDKVDCSISGLYRVYCPDCDQTILIEWKRGHENDADWDDEKEVEPREQNCTNEGNTGRFECKYCHELIGEAKTLGKLGHQYDVQELEYQAPECEKPGHAEKWVCSRCGDVDPDRDGHTIIQNHKYKTEKKAVAPTCYSVGYKELSRCEHCGAYENRDGIVLDGSEIKMTEHNMDMKYLDHTEDCTEPTLTYHYCTNPGCPFEYLDYKGEFNAASEHVWVERSGSRVPATCEDNGHVVYDCKICKESKTETLPALGHQNKDGQKLTRYCDSKDVKDRECKNCHQKIECTIKNVLQHEHLEHMTVKVTCVDDGANVEYCPVCGYSHSDIIESAKGHTYDRNTDQAPSTDIPATYAAPGKKVWKCGDCGATKEEIIPVTGTAGVTDPAKYDHGIQLLMEATNADVGGVEFVDSSTVALKISLGSFYGLDIWGIQLNLNYNANALTYLDSEVVTQKLQLVTVTELTDTDKDGKKIPNGNLMIYGQAPNNTQGRTANVKITGNEDFVVLYFQINPVDVWESGANPSLKLRFDLTCTECLSVTQPTNLTEKVIKTEVTLTVKPFVDPNGDGRLTMADLLMMTQMFNKELENNYSVSADLNKNRSIDMEDLLTAIRYYNKDITYKDILELVG